MGVNVLPRFSVFHKPPDADATYHTLGFLGSMSTSETRPVVTLGPRLRNAIALNKSVLIPSVPAGACAPSAAQQMTAITPYENVLFMLGFYFNRFESQV